MNIEKRKIGKENKERIRKSSSGKEKANADSNF